MASGPERPNLWSIRAQSNTTPHIYEQLKISVCSKMMKSGSWIRNVATRLAKPWKRLNVDMGVLHNCAQLLESVIPH